MKMKKDLKLSLFQKVTWNRQKECQMENLNWGISRLLAWTSYGTVFALVAGLRRSGPARIRNLSRPGLFSVLVNISDPTLAHYNPTPKYENPISLIQQYLILKFINNFCHTKSAKLFWTRYLRGGIEPLTLPTSPNSRKLVVGDETYAAKCIRNCLHVGRLSMLCEPF